MGFGRGNLGWLGGHLAQQESEGGADVVGPEDDGEDDRDEDGFLEDFSDVQLYPDLQWTPDKPYVNTIFNIIQSAGTAGISTTVSNGSW